MGLILPATAFLILGTLFAYFSGPRAFFYGMLAELITLPPLAVWLAYG